MDVFRPVLYWLSGRRAQIAQRTGKWVVARLCSDVGSGQPCLSEDQCFLPLRSGGGQQVVA